ncbi:MAG: hypothetical protein ABW352_07885 [Polyangiales bacterium]
MRRTAILALGLVCASARAQDKAQEKAEVVHGLSREHGKDLRTLTEHAVHDVAHAAMRPWDLFLQPLPEGKYRYRGFGFDAVILDDGRVEFRDRGAVHLRVAQLLDERMLPKNKPVPVLSFGNLDDFFAKLSGNDPHASERRTFLTKTRALREQLHEQHEQRILDRAHAELSTRLTRIANEADRMGLERAQDAVFALWDACSDDGVGDQTRVYIERFVRERCAVGEPCAFDDAALERVNTHRQSKRAFAPYAAK